MPVNVLTAAYFLLIPGLYQICTNLWTPDNRMYNVVYKLHGVSLSRQRRASFVLFLFFINYILLLFCWLLCFVDFFWPIFQWPDTRITSGKNYQNIFLSSIATEIQLFNSLRKFEASKATFRVANCLKIVLILK